MVGKQSAFSCVSGWRAHLLASVALSVSVVASPAWADEPPPPPPAEEQPAAAPAPAGEARAGVEKVVVTATRRETQLAKTPIAVTAVSGEQLAAAHVENIEDLMAVVPSLVVTNNGHPFAYTTRIRGVGTQGDNPGMEAAVGTFIDGVYRNRPGVAFGEMGEMERVEVLRGPQGTLFGRNTSAGIINVLTKKPTWENEVFGEVGLGSYDLLYGRAGINAVLAPELATRFYFSRLERDGYMDVNPGRPDAHDGNATSYWLGRGQALWQPNNDVSLRIIGDYSERKDECCAAVTIANGSASNPGGPGTGRTPTAAFPNTSAPAIINFLESGLGKSTTNQVDSLIAFGDRSTRTNTTDRGVSGELNWTFGETKLTTINSFRQWKNDYGQDADFSGADIFYSPADGTNFNDFETFTHETRLNGDLGWVDWLVGAFYANEDIQRQRHILFGADAESFLSLHRVGDSPLSLRGTLNAALGHSMATPVYAANTGDLDTYSQNAETFAFFTHNVVHLTPDLDFIAGLRWTTETKDFRASYQTTGQGGCSTVEGIFGLDPSARAAFLSLPADQQRLIALTCLPFSRHALDGFTAAAPHLQSRTEDEFSGVATFAYQFDPNLNTYATYSRGHKAGGFNLDRVFADQLGSIVVPATVPGAQTVRAPDTSFAAELVDAYELGLKFANDDDSVRVNVAGFYQDFENFQLNTFTGVSFIVTSVPEVVSKGIELETFWAPTRALSTMFAVQYTDARYGENLGSFVSLNPSLFALPGERLTHSPEWTLTGALDYGFPILETLNARFHVDARWQSEMNTGSNLDPRKVQDAYATVGMKLGVYSEGEDVALEFFARNLFDERYINTAFDSPLQGSAMTPGVDGSSTIDAFVGEPRVLGASLRLKH
jgi:outer membrane receptor protein involved in Fe transport